MPGRNPNGSSAIKPPKFPSQVNTNIWWEILKICLLCMFGFSPWRSWGTTLSNTGEGERWEKQSCAVGFCLFVCLFVLRWQLLWPNALTIYAFTEFIFMRLVMRTPGHVLRHVYTFGTWSMCMYLKGEYFYSSILPHLLLLLYIFYGNQWDSSEY